MSVKKGIQWTPKQLEKLANAVEGYNERLVSQVKQKPDLLNAGLQRLDTGKLQALIPTATELNKFVTMLNETKKPEAWEYTTNSEGIPITAHQRKNLAKLQDLANKNREIMREGMPDKPEYYGTQSDIKRNALPPLNIDLENAGYKRLKRLQQSLFKQSRSNFSQTVYDQYRENYFAGIEKNLGEERANRLKKMLENVDSGTMFKSYYQSPELTIRYIYTGSGHDTLDERYYEILEMWGKYLDMDLASRDEEMDWEEIEEDEDEWE